MRTFASNRIISAMLIFLSSFSLAQSPLNWTRDEVNPGEDFTLAPDVSVFSEGMKSCRMQLHSGAVPYLISDVYYVTPGAQYEFSFDVLDNDTAGQVKVYADFYDAYGFDIFGQPPVFSADLPEWQTLSWTGTIPGQAVVGYVLVKFYSQPDLYSFTRQADAWIDNFRFVENEGQNLILNGGFEDWLVGVDEMSEISGTIPVYPNPVQDWMTADIPENSESIIISDLSGRKLAERKIFAIEKTRKQVRIDASGLLPGMLIIKVILKDGSAIGTKIIKL